MRYFSMFSGIGTAEKGIEQAYGTSNQSERKQPKTQRQHERNNVHVESGRSPMCIGFAEIDRYAASIYKYHWPEVRNYGDATKIVCDELPDFDFLVGGFPCQAFSIAGKRKGFQDTRGTLFFEIARILEAKRPGHFLLENVAGLLSHDNGQTFRTIIATLDEIGYDTEWTVINSKHHGVPQNRERVFIVGHIRDGCSGEILSFGHGDGELADEQNGERHDFAHTITNGDKQRGSYDIASTLGADHAFALDANYAKGCNDIGKSRRTIVDSAARERVTIGTLRIHKDGQGFREMQSNVAPTLNGRARQDGSQQGVGLYSDRVNGTDTAGTLKSRNDSGRGKNHNQTGVLVERAPLKFLDRNGKKVDGDYAFAVDMVNTGGVRIDKRIRRLTPTECERLQGLPDGHTKYGIDAKGNTYEVSDSQRYKTLGNAMTVNVIEALITAMLREGCLRVGERDFSDPPRATMQCLA